MTTFDQELHEKVSRAHNWILNDFTKTAREVLKKAFPANDQDIHPVIYGNHKTPVLVHRRYYQEFSLHSFPELDKTVISNAPIKLFLDEPDPEIARTHSSLFVQIDKFKSMAQWAFLNMSELDYLTAYKVVYTNEQSSYNQDQERAVAYFQKMKDAKAKFEIIALVVN